MKNKELEILLSEKNLKLGEKEIVVKRLSMISTLKITTNLSGVVARIMSNPDVLSSALAKISYVDSTGEVDGLLRVAGFMELLGQIDEDGVELLVDIIERSTTLTRQEIEELDPVEGMELLSVIYEVNEGFFKKCGRKLQEKIQKLSATLKERAEEKQTEN